MKRLSTILFIFGLICYSFGIFFILQRNISNPLAFQNYSQKVVKIKAKSIPKRIIIKNLNIDIPVYTASIKNNIWETSTLGANYLVSSPIPGERGNSILYAHNWEKLFGNLVGSKPGDIIEIDYANSSKKIFIVTETAIVPPTQSNILMQSKDTRITLYTCTGFLDSSRFVVTALLKSDIPNDSVLRKFI
jgi:LPXTG-site transpeptidase (sortase) family protein